MEGSDKIADMDADQNENVTTKMDANTDKNKKEEISRAHPQMQIHGGCGLGAVTMVGTDIGKSAALKFENKVLTKKQTKEIGNLNFGTNKVKIRHFSKTWLCNIFICTMAYIIIPLCHFHQKMGVSDQELDLLQAAVQKIQM